MDTSLIYIILSPCVVSTLKSENIIFDILNHGLVFNLIQVENYGV